NRNRNLVRISLLDRLTRGRLDGQLFHGRRPGRFGTRDSAGGRGLVLATGCQTGGQSERAKNMKRFHRVSFLWFLVVNSTSPDRPQTLRPNLFRCEIHTRGERKIAGGSLAGNDSSKASSTASGRGAGASDGAGNGCIPINRTAESPRPDI